MPILSRFMFENDFKPGPFSLGVLVSSVSACLTRSLTNLVFAAVWNTTGWVTGLILILFARSRRGEDELYVGRLGRGDVARDGVVLFPGVWRRALVSGAKV